MRANSPTDNDFDVLNVVEDTPAQQKVPNEMKRLVKASNSADGKIILDHLQERLDAYTQVLKYTDLMKAQDNVIALATVIAAQSVIQEFEAVLNDVEISKQAVADATKRS